MAAEPAGSPEALLTEEMRDPGEELERLLAEGVAGAKLREATSFDELAGKDRTDLLLFGAGGHGRYTASGLRNAGIEPICFIDNNAALWGQRVEGVPVLSPAEGIRRYGSTAVFVVTVWRGEGTEKTAARIAHLQSQGCKTVVPFLPLFWKYAEHLLPRYALDLPHRAHEQAGAIRKAFGLMADDLSRREFVAQLRWRLFGDSESLPDPVVPIYFREELFSITDHEDFVDCGAYDGDTLAQFLAESRNRISSAWLFEPDPANCDKLMARVATLPDEVRPRIRCYNAATGETNVRVRMMTGAGVASSVGAGDLEVECVTLDSVLGDAPVSYLKLDVEGFELPTLRGAAQSIRRNKPILAMSAYHRQDDIWVLPLYIHELDPEYKLYLRPHLLEGWDLVLYAVPPSRSLP
ncbi:Methyltransferase FkbM [Candidatus Koribacter versatilis Ellin345]|uniref:Methyltransferase FkbM n=1 Tax=Koribacter versatilis (strain Ellin345) TaxID=204669 RepID=Q1IMQ4_KORVE|nr:Methyltransferase FkbM [Candidatus Koribacter versatilis Ellin345]